MAESSIVVYFIAGGVLALLGIYLLGIRSKRSTFPYRTTSHTRLQVGIWIIFVGIFFIYIGIVLVDFSTLFIKYQDKDYYKFEEPTDIKLEDFQPMKKWMTNAEIQDTEDRHLIEGVEKRLHVWISADEFPQQLVMYVFHEDMKNYFTNNNTEGFRQLVKKSNNVPDLSYGSISSIKFNTTSCINPLESEFSQDSCSLLNAFGMVDFDYPGKYFVQFSAKLQTGEFDHRFTPMHLTIIPSEREVFDTTILGEMRSELDTHKFFAQNALGVAYLAIGVGMLFSGLTLLSPTILRRSEWLRRRYRV